MIYIMLNVEEISGFPKPRDVNNGLHIKKIKQMSQAGPYVYSSG